MSDRSPDLSRMQSLIGKSWHSWNLPEAATEQDLKKMRAQFKPKETKIPLEHTNPLPTALMYLYGSRPEFDLFSITKCPGCKKYFKTQWLNNHFIQNAANENLCKTTGKVVDDDDVIEARKKKIAKRSHESRHHSRHRSSHDHHRHRSEKTHRSHSESKSKRPSLTIISDKKYKDRLSSPSKPKSKEKVVEDKRHKDSKSSNKRHNSPKDRRVSNSASYTLSIPDDKDENIPVKVLLANKKSSRHENRPSLQIISEKSTKVLKSVSNEKIKPHKDSTEKKGKSISGSVHSGHKHKKTSNSHSRSDHSPSPTKSSIKDDYRFKIPLKSKSSDSRSQSAPFETSKSLSKDSSKHKSHSGAETIKANDVATLPKVAYRSPSNILSNSNIPNKHSSGNTTVSSLKIALQSISPIKASTESESAVATKSTSKSYGKDKSSNASVVVSPKHSLSSSKGATASKSTSSSSKSASSSSSNKSPVSVPSTKPSLTIISSKPIQSILSPELKLPPISKSSLNSVKSTPPAPTSKLSSSKTSLSRSSSSLKSSSSSSSSTSKSSSLSPSKFPTTSSSSKGSSKAPTAVSPRSSPLSISKSPSSSSLKSSSSNSSSKSSLSSVSSAKSPASALLPFKPTSSKSQSSSSKSSKTQLPLSKPTPGSNIIMTSSSVRTPSMTSITSISLSSGSDSLSSYDSDASYIKAELRAPSLNSKSNAEAPGKYSTATKDKKSSKTSSSAVAETVASKQTSSSKDKRHSGKHGSNPPHSSLTIESKSPSTEKSSSKEKKSSTKSSLTVISSETKTSKTSSPVATKKSSQSSLPSPTSYKSVSPPHSSSFSSTLPPAYIAPSWTSAFKSSIAQTLTSAAKGSLPSTIQSSSSYSLSMKNSYAKEVHKSPMIASTSSAIQSTIAASSAISPTLLNEQLGAKGLYGSATYLKAGALSPEVPSPEKPEPPPTHHRKKKKKKDKDEPRKIIPLKDRCFHPDQHCGVVVAPSVMPCKRSLTCKTHSIALRRAVAGRSSSFDSLLAAHKKARDEEKLTKSEKRDTVINVDVPERVEILTPRVASPVPTNIASIPVEIPVAPPVIPTVVPEVLEAVATPDSKENEAPEQSECESPEAEPDVIFMEELPITVIDPKEVKDGTSFFEVSKSHEERPFNVTGQSLKCHTKDQFTQSCRQLKRKIDQEKDCLIFHPNKILVEKGQNAAKRRKFNFVSVRGMPKDRSKTIDEYSSFLGDNMSPETEEGNATGTEEKEDEANLVNDEEDEVVFLKENRDAAQRVQDEEYDVLYIEEIQHETQRVQDEEDEVVFLKENRDAAQRVQDEEDEVVFLKENRDAAQRVQDEEYDVLYIEEIQHETQSVQDEEDEFVSIPINQNVPQRAEDEEEDFVLFGGDEHVMYAEEVEPSEKLRQLRFFLGKDVEERQRLVKGKSSRRIVNSLRNRHAARRIAAINQAIFADTCANHKMYLLSQQAKMARLALRSNDVERAKRHLTVKRIMASKDPLSFTVQRLAKWLVRNKLGFSKKESMFASSHQLVEKCMLDRKRFLSKQYILIRKQLEDRERVTARKRFLKCYKEAVKRSLLSSKCRIRVSRKLVSAKQKKLDRHFRLNVYRNLRRIRRHLLKKQLTMLRLSISRNILFNKQKHIARKLCKSKNSSISNRQRLTSLLKKGVLSKNFLTNESNFLKRTILKENVENSIKTKGDKIVGHEKSQKPLLGSQLTLRSNKPRVITVIMPMSKSKAAAMLKQCSSKGSVNDGTNYIQNVNPNEFKSIIGSRIVKGKLVSATAAPVANEIVRSGQNKGLVARQTGQNILHNHLVTARDILSIHQDKIAQPKKKILFGRNCKIDEQMLLDLRQRLTVSKNLSKSQMQPLSQINSSAKGQSSVTLDSKPSKSNSKLTPSKANVSNISKNSKKAVEVNLKEQKGTVKPIRTSRPVAEGDKKGVSNNSQVNSSVSQPATPKRSKSLNQNREIKISSSNQNAASGLGSTDMKSKITAVGDTQKINPTVGGSLLNIAKNPRQSKLCKYRVVSQNIPQNSDINNDNPNDKKLLASKKLTKVSHFDKNYTASVNIATDKSKVKKDKVDSVKRVVAQATGAVGNAKQRVTKEVKSRADSQILVKNMQYKGESASNNNDGIETNRIYSKKQESGGLGCTRLKTNGAVSSTEVKLKKDSAMGNQSLAMQRDYVMLLLAVKNLLTEKSKSGDKKFSEQETKLIKLYLKFQSNKSKNVLIATCLKANGNDGALYKNSMSSST